jgi:hypothetical protein
MNQAQCDEIKAKMAQGEYLWDYQAAMHALEDAATLDELEDSAGYWHTILLQQLQHQPRHLRGLPADEWIAQLRSEGERFQLFSEQRRRDLEDSYLDEWGKRAGEIDAQITEIDGASAELIAQLRDLQNRRADLMTELVAGSQIYATAHFHVRGIPGGKRNLALPDGTKIRASTKTEIIAALMHYWGSKAR